MSDPPSSPPVPALSALEELPEQLAQELAPLTSEAAIRDAHARAVKGPIAQAQAMIRQAPPAQKKAIGAALNRAKQAVDAAYQTRLQALADEARAADLERAIDVSLPGRGRGLGHLHVLTQTRRTIEGIFRELGFDLAEGPQVETDFNNFEALNMPRNHPARDMQDTFYISDDVVLRTHTSPVQVRTMLAHPPPVKVICPGIVYRRDDDPTHSPMFSQVEGLLVDREVSMADLKGTLLHFVKRFFGPDVGMRFRASFFPFTEPSAEVDISCIFCSGGPVRGSPSASPLRCPPDPRGSLATGALAAAGGTGCRLCKGTGWLEIGGCGMIDPEVYRAVGYDPEAVTGFAFGMGVERMAMLRHGVPDLRLYFEGDVRFLRQF